MWDWKGLRHQNHLFGEPGLHLQARTENYVRENLELRRQLEEQERASNQRIDQLSKEHQVRQEEWKSEEKEQDRIINELSRQLENMEPEIEVRCFPHHGDLQHRDISGEIG